MPTQSRHFPWSLDLILSHIRSQNTLLILTFIMKPIAPTDQEKINSQNDLVPVQSSHNLTTLLIIVHTPTYVGQLYSLFLFSSPCTPTCHLHPPPAEIRELAIAARPWVMRRDTYQCQLSRMQTFKPFCIATQPRNNPWMIMCVRQGWLA